MVNYKNCPNCGNKVEKSIKKCPYCGQYLYPYLNNLIYWKRNEKIVERVRKGETYRKISDEIGLSEARIGQIYNTYKDKKIMLSRVKNKKEGVKND